MSSCWPVAYPMSSPAGRGVAERGGSVGSCSDRETGWDHQGAPCCPSSPDSLATVSSGCSTHPEGLLGHRSVPYAQSPSLFRYMARLVILLIDTAFSQDCLWNQNRFPFLFLALLVGHVTLRLLKPECDLDEAWGQEDLDTAAHRTILLLHNYTVPQRDSKTSGEDRDFVLNNVSC